MSAEIKGSCLCGQIRFTTPGPLRPVIACHCTQCRKTTGHFVAATSVLRTGVTITGAPRWYASSSQACCGFCAKCGSQLFWDGKGTHLSIFAGSIDGATGVKMAGHIFCADKGDYYEIANGLPQAAAEDPVLTTRVDSAEVKP